VKEVGVQRAPGKMEPDSTGTGNEASSYLVMVERSGGRIRSWQTRHGKATAFRASRSP